MTTEYNKKEFVKTINTDILFKHCCLHDRPYVYLRALRIAGRRNAQLKANISFIETNSKIDSNCCNCKNKLTEESISYYATYWTPNLWKSVCKGCREETIKSEQIACQIIDANCNECKFFKRGESKGKLTEDHLFLKVKFGIAHEEKREWQEGDKLIQKNLPILREAVIGDEVKFNGFCEKKNIQTQATSNICSGYDCFEHRKL
jgi:hypothetical protein